MVHALLSMAIPDRSARTIATLKQLARELNVPVETFLRVSAEGEAGDLLTLVRLWSAIPDTQRRRRVLSVARREAERSESKARA
jgi:transcriptional regulator with XRE-family HTH domain